MKTWERRIAKERRIKSWWLSCNHGDRPIPRQWLWNVSASWPSRRSWPNCRTARRRIPNYIQYNRYILLKVYLHTISLMRIYSDKIQSTHSLYAGALKVTLILKGLGAGCCWCLDNTVCWVAGRSASVRYLNIRLCAWIAVQLLTRARAVIDFFFFFFSPYSRLFLFIINAIYLVIYSVCVCAHTRASHYIAAHFYTFPVAAASFSVSPARYTYCTHMYVGDGNTWGRRAQSYWTLRSFECCYSSFLYAHVKLSREKENKERFL